MSIKITFFDPDIRHWCDIQIPEGLPDIQSLKEHIWKLQLSRAGKRSAFRVAKRQYKSYYHAPDLWGETDEEV